MHSIQYEIWKLLLKARYQRRARQQENELSLGQAFEMPRPPKLLQKKNNIEEYQQGPHSIFVCHPEKLKSEKVIFYLHGGAYYTRIMLPHWIFIRKLSNLFGVKVIVPDYPTAPAYNYLQTNQFVIQAYEGLLKENLPSNIYFFGDSAGGGLALILSQQLNIVSLPQPAGLVLLCPWLDISMTNPDISVIEKDDFMLSLDNLLIAAELYAEDADLKDPLVSPIYGSLEGLPVINLFIGSSDILLPDCRKMKQITDPEKTKLNYFEYKKMFHCWMLFPIPEADDVVRKIQDLMDIDPEVNIKNPGKGPAAGN